MLTLALCSMFLQAPATAVAVTGHAEVIAAEVTEKLERFDTVPEGATVVTHERSTVSLRLPSGAQLRLGPSTSLVIKELAGDAPAVRRERFAVTVGKIWASVLRLTGTSSSFEVETKNAVAGVRGTAFFVEVGEEDNDARFVVDHGFIAVTRDAQMIELAGPGAALRSGPGGLVATSRLTGPALRTLRRSVGGAAALLGGGYGGLAGLPALQRAERQRQRQISARPEALFETTAPGPTLGAAAGSASRIEINVALP